MLSCGNVNPLRPASILLSALCKYPQNVDGQAITPLEGVSLRPAWNGGELDRQDGIYWEHEGNRAIRDGKWKLVAKGAKGPWELYDLEEDRTELNNLAAKQPARAKNMADRWEAWALNAKAKPWPCIGLL